MPNTVSQRRNSFSAKDVTKVIREVISSTAEETETRWLRAVAARVLNTRPDLQGVIREVLKVEPSSQNLLKGLSIGEIGVCYEALRALQDSGGRKQTGQYFTPDDAAQFMAKQSLTFPQGTWMDPCCGVGNLAWHLTSLQENPSEFARKQLILNDWDETALRSAVVLIGADFLSDKDEEGMRELLRKSSVMDFLEAHRIPTCDFVIVNPPYARTSEKPDFETAATKESFSYFMERIVRSTRGFISVTPASYVSAPKFEKLRQLIDAHTRGGDIYVFDNVPDTLFRGYKFGSSNSSKTNFVRAAITVADPNRDHWDVTPIIRWRSRSRARMFEGIVKLLSTRMEGPDGAWAKIPPKFEHSWNSLMKEKTQLKDLILKEETPYSLNVALTPRYYISASYKNLNRRSKVILYFANQHDRDRAAVVLNSSLPYIWWRALDGGVTLPLRVLRTVPIPSNLDISQDLLDELRLDEEKSMVTKLNAGLINENIKRPRELVSRLNQIVIPQAAEMVDFFYDDDLFREDPIPV